jgi:hypothetical protein
MSHPGHLARRRVALWLGAAAVAAAGLGALSFAREGAPKARAATGALVAPDFAAHKADIRLIMVTTPEGTYHIARDGERWVLTEKGRYPVRAELVAQLEAALSTMRHGEPRTRDPRKLDRIGLGDPLQGGTGALVEVGNGNGDVFAKLIIGSRDGRTYVRKPDDPEAWLATDADPPPLHRAARWLDLDVARVQPAEIAEIEVRPQVSPAYKLKPADAQGARFLLAPPFDQRRLIAGFAPNPPALVLTQLSPEDVAPAGSLASAKPAAEHVTRLTSGLEIRIRAVRAATGGWILLDARAASDASPEIAVQAAAINERAGPWAFAISELDWNAVTTPLAAIAE